MGDTQQQGSSDILRQGTVEELVASRDAAYGSAWRTTNVVLNYLYRSLDQPIHALMDSGYFFSWLMILNKLIRAMHSPGNIDHWKDIAGYAVLVSNGIAEELHE